jgi:3'-5' exonuclease
MSAEIVFDVETIPTQDVALIAHLRAEADAQLGLDLEAVRAPGNYRDAEKIIAYVTDARSKLIEAHESSIQQAYLKTALDGGLGQIVCFGLACDDEPARVIMVDDLSPASEAQALRRFFDVLADSADRYGAKLIGHNSNSFDLPYIWKRAIVHNVQPPTWFPLDPKPWDKERTFDTMTAWAGARGYITLARLGRILGVSSSDDVAGAGVWSLVQAGDFAKVASHCLSDVERTRAVYRRMMFRGAA